MLNQIRRLYEFGPFRLDSAERTLTRDGQAVALPPKVFDTLVALVENSGRLMDKEALMSRLWPDAFVEEATLARHVSDLRKVLGETAGDNQYIETVPKRGYRFVAEVREARDSGPAPVVEKPPRLRLVSQAPPAEGRKSSSWKRVAVLVATLALALTAALVYLWQAGRGGASDGGRTVAVLPFEPISPAGRDEHLEFGMAETLITKLSNINRLIVRPMGSVRKYAELDQDPLAAGRALQVDFVLEGSLQKQDERLRVTARLMRVGDGQSLWSGTFNEKATDIFRLQDTLTEQIVAALLLKLAGEEKQRLARRYTESAEADQLYQRGLYFWNLRTEEGYYKAIEQFRQAIQTDPNYALAYAGLADCYHLLGDYSFLPPDEAFPKATEAAAAALRIDDTLAAAHTSLAYAKFLYDWDWATAEREFREALALSPTYATAHQRQGEYLAALGRFGEAREALRRARGIDPTSRILSATEGWIAYIARDYDRALELCQQALDLEVSFYPAHFWRGQAYEKKGMYREALAAYEKALVQPG